MKENNLTYSIIIIVFNGQDTLRACLDSLVNQDFPKRNLEIIVVDNNSTDNTKEIIKQYPVRYIFEPKRNRATARNRGLREAKGQYVAFIDSDCIADKYWFRYLVEETINNHLIAGGGAIVYRESQDLLGKYIDITRRNTREVVILSEIYIPFIPLGNAIFKRTIFNKIGMFDEDIPRDEDVDFSLRLLCKGYELKYIPKAIVYHQTYKTDLNSFIKDKFLIASGIIFNTWKYSDIFKFNIILDPVRNIFYFLSQTLYIKRPRELKYKINWLFIAIDLMSCFVIILGIFWSWLFLFYYNKKKIHKLSKEFLGHSLDFSNKEIDFNGRHYLFNSEIMCWDFNSGKEFIFFDVKNRLFYSLGDVGAKMLELLINNKDSDYISHSIAESYNIKEDIVEKDLCDLIGSLRKKIILR